MPVPVLDILIATGPIFSMSRIIGKERTRRIEELLLRSFDALLHALPLVILLALSLGVLFTVALISKLFSSYLEGIIDGTTRSSSPFTILVLLAVSVYGIPLLWRWQLHLVYDYGRSLCQHWRKLSKSPPPWPFSDFEATFSYPRVLAFLMFYTAPLTIFYVVIVPTAWLCACVVMIPFWGAEKLRAALTPENPNFLDILAYLISVLAMALKLRDLWRIT